MNDILHLLSRNGRYTVQELAAMTRRSEEEISSFLEDCEKRGVLLGYQAIIDWDKTSEDVVTALIDIKVTPQRGEGFDRVAERIYQYDEVESLSLMSGGYDLSVCIRGRTMREVALFVAQKLAPLESVAGTATHFVLKKYKDNGVVYDKRDDAQERIEFI